MQREFFNKKGCRNAINIIVVFPEGGKKGAVQGFSRRIARLNGSGGCSLIINPSRCTASSILANADSST